MNFSEQPPSKQWAALKFRGEKITEVWFKPEGEPSALILRIPQKSFQIPGLGQQLTMEILLKAMGIEPAEVESWLHGDVSHPGMDGSNPELGTPLPTPQHDVTHLDILVRLKSPPQADASDGSGQPGVVSEQWQDLESRWKVILGMEATMDTLRMNMESLLSEMDGSLKKTLTHEEKLHAKRADLAHWTKAKNRVHHALPRMREFIHRAVWAMGAPERKQLGELFKNHLSPDDPIPQMNKLLGQLENLQKDRQVLSAQGVTVYQECKGLASNVQEALRTLQSNAAANAYKKKGAAKGGKFFKQIRRMSGAE